MFVHWSCETCRHVSNMDAFGILLQCLFQIRFNKGSDCWDLVALVTSNQGILCAPVYMIIFINSPGHQARRRQTEQQQQEARRLRMRRRDPGPKVRVGAKHERITGRGQRAEKAQKWKSPFSPPQHKGSTWVTQTHSHSSLELGSRRRAFLADRKSRLLSPEPKYFQKGNKLKTFATFHVNMLRIAKKAPHRSAGFCLLQTERCSFHEN